MPKQRMKMDINNLIRNIDEVIFNSRSKIARENGYGISIGLDLLISYLKEIGQLAIDQNNQELIEILLDMHVLRSEEGNGEDRFSLCDMGFYNEVIRGYLIESMTNANFSGDEIDRALAGLNSAFDWTTAAEAAEIFRKK